MRIAIDATSICARDGSAGAGIEHYTEAVCRGLVSASNRHAFDLFVPAAYPVARSRALFSGKARVHRALPFSIPFVSRHLLYPARLSAFRPDVVFVPGGVAPFACPAPFVATVHDLTIYRHPEWFAARANEQVSIRLLVPRTVRRATSLIAVSKATRRDLGATFGEDAEAKCRVIPEGVEIPAEIDALRKPEGVEDIVLCLGTIEPRKNIGAALDAYQAYLRMHPDRSASTRLYLAGSWGWEGEALRKRIEAESGVHMLGRVSEGEKWALLKGASALLFPSLEEGFGLPALEAMAVGTPVIASNRGAIPEVCADAALLADPDDTEALALALAQVLLVPEGARQFAAAGVERAAQFTWQCAARETLAALEKAAKR
jgi:alpha-1,3-rhamnosyl/mannosyltransferase